MPGLMIRINRLFTTLFTLQLISMSAMVGAQKTGYDLAIYSDLEVRIDQHGNHNHAVSVQHGMEHTATITQGGAQNRLQSHQSGQSHQSMRASGRHG